MEDSIFARMARGEMPVETIYETGDVMAFHDTAPQAPVHVIVIPKKPLQNVGDMKAGDEGDVHAAGALLAACAEVARILHIDQTGFRVVFNTGENAGQTVPYLHAHLMGGGRLLPMG